MLDGADRVYDVLTGGVMLGLKWHRAVSISEKEKKAEG